MKTETELKETWCPDARAQMTITNKSGRHEDSGAPAANRIIVADERDGSVIDTVDAGKILGNCIGFACSQCVDGGAVIESLMRTGGEARPPGEGWRIAGGNGEWWRRETGERYAYCGRNVGEALRNELGQIAVALERIGNIV